MRRLLREQKDKRDMKKTGIFFGRDAKASIHKTALVKNGKDLTFGCVWSRAERFPSSLIIGANAIVEVHDKFYIYSGAHISVNKDAVLKLGSGFINDNTYLVCKEKIVLGNDVAIGPNVSIRDSDDHIIDGKTEKVTAPVIIGNHVWIGEKALILKGVVIGDGCIIAAGTVVTKSVPPNSLVAGTPGRVIKENITWE